MYAKVQLLFIRCRQLENVIRFLSHIIIYILTACQILFWSKFNQRHKHVYSLGINHLSKWQNIKFISTKKHVNTIWYGKYIDKVTHWDTSLTLSPVYCVRFWNFLLYIFLCKNHTSSFWPHPTYDNHGVNKLILNWIQTFLGCFHTSLNLNSVQEKKRFLKFFFYLLYCYANLQPSLWPHPHQRIMIWTNFKFPESAS